MVSWCDSASVLRSGLVNERSQDSENCMIKNEIRIQVND